MKFRRYLSPKYWMKRIASRVVRKMIWRLLG